MPISIVTDSQGKRHRVEHPEGASQSSIFTFVEEQINPQGRAPRVIDADDSFAVDVAKGLFAGGSQAAVSSAAGITQWAGQTFGSEGMLEAAEDMRQYSQGIGEDMGLDQDFRESFFGQVVQGLGQVPVTIGAGAVGLATAGPVGMIGAAALTTGGQMTSEFLTDMEQTVGKQYTDFNVLEKEAALKGMLAQTALGTTLELAAVGKAVRPLLRRIKSGKGVSSKALKKAIEQDKGALREIAESGLAEGFTEASQGQSLDTLASMLYDEDRELLTMDTLKRRSMEFGVGAIVGGTVSGGAQILGSPGKTSTTNKDLGKPVEGRSEVSVPREIQVTYKPVDGPTTTVTLAPDEGESAIDAAERILEGRRLPGSDMTVNEVIEQTPIDVVLGETEGAVLEEDVPVDPAPTPTPTPAPDPIGDRRFEDNVAVEESDYILPDVELDDIARLDVGQMSDEELQKLIESYNKYNGEGDRVRNLDYLQDYAEIFNRELEGDLSEAEVQAEIDKNNKKYNAERKRIARAIKERDARARGEASQLSEADFDALVEEAQSKRGRGRTQTPTPTPTTELEPSVETAPESEVDPRTGLPGFSLPQNLKKGKPGYQKTQNVKFASDLERAAYSATTTPRDETAKRKRAKYRKILQDAGYSSTEINTMGREVRSQMRKQYKGPGSELSVALPQDIVAPVAALDGLEITQEEIDTINQRLDQEPDPIGQAGDRIPNILDEKDITAQAFTPYRKEMMPKPEVVKAALPIFTKLKSGERITTSESRQLASVIDRVNPVRPYKEVPPPASESDMLRGLDEGKRKKINQARNLSTGTFVKLRLDIPAYRDHGVWVPTIHGATEKTKSFRGGSSISHQSTSVVTNAKFGIIGYDKPAGQVVATGIASKKETKIPIATILGQYVNLTEDQAVARAEAAIKDPSFVQVGMDPKRRGYFYNRSTMQEVLSADEVIQVGPLVLAKNPVYGKTPRNEFLSREVEGAVDQDVVAEAAPLEISQVSDENNSLRIGTALQKGKNTTTPEDNVSPDRITPANLKKQMAKMTHFVKKIVKDGKEKGRDVKFPKWMRAKGGAKAQSEAFIKQFKDNLIALHNAFPAEYRARATQWYDGARKIVDRAAEQTGLTPEQVAGVMAALSPLKDWFQNVQMGLNLVDVATNNSDDVFTQAQYKDAINIVLDQSSDNTVRNQRKKLFKLLEGKTIRELFNQGTKESKQLAAWVARIISTGKHGFYHDVLSPEGNSLGIRRNKDGSPKAMVWQSIPFIVKSLDIVYDGSVENISNQLGKKHKIRNFYNNIIAPNSPYGDATIDTHAVNATTLFPMGGSGYQADLNFGKAGVGGGGVSGTYWLHLEAYKQAAKEVGLQPRQMQSITWEAIRMLFPDVDKRDQKFIDKYENIWNNSTDAETTRQQILSEGIEPPEWATYRPRPLRGAEAVEASVRENARPKVEPTRSVQADDGPTSRGDVTAQAAETAAEDRGPQDTFDNINQLEDFISKSFSSIADKMGINIYPNMVGQFVAQYNVSQKIIEYNPRALLNRTKAGVQAAMREEIIHAAMHNVLIQKEKKARTGRSEDALWVDFFTALGNNLTPQERTEIQNVYQSLQEGNAVAFGSEYSRAVVQKFRYGDFTEQYIAVDKGGPAFQAIVDLLRSVQAYMAKVLGPMVKTNPEAAQVIVDTVELLDAIDPTIRPKSQQVVANAYNETDKNTAEENTDPGESVDAKASERIREERKWFADSSLRKTASKYLTPVITRLNRINPMFGRMLQNLDTAIRERSFRHQKQTKAFFNRLNAIKGAEFDEMKQLLFFSPTPEEASRPRNKAKMQRRDALLHKYGLLNMYRLDVQPIMEEIYAEYTKLGMPAMGYLEDYFPRVVKDLEGLIKSYGQKTKRTFELLVEEENKRRSNIEESKGGPLPAMEKTELARFFQDFLQNKFRVDINGARLPGNVKVRDIQLIPEDKLQFYDNPGVAFSKYTTNMNRAIESFKVVGDTRKGRLQGELGKLTEELFSSGQIDQADADTVKSLTELITTQFQAENEILKSLGTLTYMATLINPGPVLVQIMDLYKVALYRGLGGVVSGVYRTVTGNRRFDLEDDFSISKTQLSAEFQDPTVLQKALDFGLSRLVPFRQMDTAMKHASIEAAYDDFVKKAKSPVGSKKYEQLKSFLTIKMGAVDAMKTINDLKANKAANSERVKEALLAELLERQPLTYLQVPEGYQTDPSKRLFYKLSTFMLLDLNYNRQEFMNDLGGPGKTLQQRTAALRRLTYMATLLTMFGLPSDLLDDWISGKDTYIPEHVMNNMLGMFGLSKYTTTRALEKGTVESVIQRFTPPAVNIIVKGEESLRSWVKGDVELFEMKAWRNSPLSDVWYNRTGAGKKQQEKLQKERRKEGVRPTFDRS